MTRSLCHRSIFIALCLALSSAAGGAETSSELTQAQTLLNAGKAADAYALLLPLQFEQAGDPVYDYLLGVAALDSGNFNAATFAFERVLAVNPNHAGARMDMARAYFALNDLSRAAEQFKLVLTLNPPASVKKLAESHLARIEVLQKARFPALTAYVEATLGYDTNITNVTRDFSNAVFQSYGIAGLQPLGNSIPRDDAYFGVNTGLLYNLPQDENASLFFGLDAKQKEYFTEHNYRSTTLNGQFGYSLKHGQDTYRVALNLQHFLQQGEAATTTRTRLDSDVYGIAGSWQHLLDTRTQLSLFAQFNIIRYEDLPLSDVNATTVGAALTRSIAAPYQPVVLGSVFHTRESAQNNLPNGTDLSKEVVGLRLAGQVTLDPNLEAYASLGYQFRDDTKLGARQSGIFGQDRYADLTLGMSWKLDKDWSLRPQIAYSRNQSNIAVYTSNRTDYSLTLRKEFR